MVVVTVLGLVAAYLSASARADCTPNTTDTDGLQALLTGGGQNYTLSLCQSQTYSLDQILNYTAAGQEISTEGYPNGDARATFVVNGFNVSTAVQATSTNLDGVKLRYVQINGNRGSSDIYTGSGANIEFGGENTGQLIEYVRSYDPRGWSCMHISEGPFKCSGVTIQNNDIGPCGSQSFQQWSDGISLSCQSSLVQNNTITDATDGGIVIFGAPSSTIRNNTIHVKTRTTLGGINMVDPVPWPPEGNFSHVVVEDNTIIGGYATDFGNETYGTNNASAMIKIGVAIGPRVWFSDGRYGTNQSTGAVVQNNLFSGAFVFAMGVSSAKNFIIQNNTFFGNVSFFGYYGPNCTRGPETPAPPVALLYEPSTLTNTTLTPGSVPPAIASAHNDTTTFMAGCTNGLTCFLPPPNNTVLWPYGGGGVNSYVGGAAPNGTAPGNGSTGPTGTNATKTSAAGRVVGCVGIPLVAAAGAAVISIGALGFA